MNEPARKRRSAGVSGAPWKILLGVWMLCVTVAAFLYAPPALGFQNPGLARILFFHVPNSIVGTVVSALSAWFAIRYLAKRLWLDDAKSKTFATLALLFWILTTVTGSIFAKVQWGAYWNWDPKQSAIFVLLLFYLAYFAIRSGITDPDNRAKIAAGYTLFAAVTVPFLTYILPNSTPQTLHPKGVVFSENGMDSTYKLIFWSAVIGFFGMTAWIYQITMRVERIEKMADSYLEQHQD